ncbi:hypothetical protein [Usitatibacter palustris]|uniref:Uncharacterized protein n=1 Tax=Usitatibacter palustris TaxID=2732487 RepID=A0A6M4H6Z2_9PROT|nr:hypothetical protein [Usitatibacter palustris]QJR15399.1 hypothetical protein DSM104440_02218 [Usitatibacter palustris]
MLRLILAATLLAIATGARAQAVPTINYTDLWWNPSESGQGLSLSQSTTSNQLFALWYTYDPRVAETDTATAGDFKPMWLSMPSGTWTTPTQFTGAVYATVGTPFALAWNTNNYAVQQVGTFTFTFTSADAATFSYNIAPPAGLPAGNPAANLPTFSGSRSIQRLSF